MPRSTLPDKPDKGTVFPTDHVAYSGLDKLKLSGLATNIDHDRIAYIEDRFLEPKQYVATRNPGKESRRQGREHP